MTIKNGIIALFSSALLIAACSNTKTALKVEEAPINERMLVYQDYITPDYLNAHLSIFASDEFAGRETGLRGQKIATQYLVAQLKTLNIQAGGENESYIQKVPMTASQKDSTVYSIMHRNDAGEWIEHSKSISSINSDAMISASWGGTAEAEGEIVYAGFGVNDEENGVMHLGADMDLSGKYVLAFYDIPHEKEGETLIADNIDWRARFGQVVRSKGARGLLLIGEDDFSELQANARLDYEKYSDIRLSYLDQGSSGNDRLYSYIAPTLAAELLGVENIEDAHAALMEDVKGFEPKALDKKLHIKPYARDIDIDTENILGYIPGSDTTMAEEVVILTAHFDHVGIGAPDENGDTIYNGADDDGSGSIGLLAVAKAMQEAYEDGNGPRRSVLFLWVTGEEKGLLGSRYYSDHPIYPIENTIANINIDMIGRIDAKYEEKGVEDYSYIIGGEIISSDIDSMLKVANTMSGNIELDMEYNDLKDPNQFYRRSDHWNFGRFGIPFVFFFTGVHDDYHRPGDEVHKIGFDKMSKIARTIYATTVMLANDDKKPITDNQEFIEITKSQAR